MPSRRYFSSSLVNALPFLRSLAMVLCARRMSGGSGSGAATVTLCTLLVLSCAVSGVQAVVGQKGSGYSTAILQKVPEGSWKRVQQGGCLVGLSNHLVVDPQFPDIQASLQMPNFIGAQLCEWLDAQLEHHKSVGKIHLKKPTGLSRLFRRAKPYDFKDHLIAVVRYMDFVDYEKVPGVQGHVPTPWMLVTFLYEPPTPAFGQNKVAFVAQGHDPTVPTGVHLLMSPEIASQLVGSQGKREFQGERLSSNKIKEGEDLPSEVEQPLLLRNFMVIGGKCSFLDGRLQTEEVKLCEWASKWAEEYPSASATMRVQKAALFTSSPSGFLAVIRLESPEYSMYSRTVPVSLEPSTSRAGLFQAKYDKLVQKFREM